MTGVIKSRNVRVGNLRKTPLWRVKHRLKNNIKIKVKEKITL
jgi:hypothetical protein